jgi:hypothetical protein
LSEIPKGLGGDEREDAVALVRFKHCQVHMFGPPNDETFEDHPLAARGLEPYSVFRNGSEIHGFSNP